MNFASIDTLRPNKAGAVPLVAIFRMIASELAELKAIRPDLPMLVVRSTGGYVRAVGQSTLA